MSGTAAVELLAVPGLPLIKPGDDLAALIADGLDRGGLKPRAHFRGSPHHLERLLRL